MSRIEELQRLYDADPQDADVLYMLAQEHEKLGDHRAAVSWYDRCLGVQPDYLYAYFHKAKSQESDEESAAALETARAGLERAKMLADEKASSELAGLVEELEGGSERCVKEADETLDLFRRVVMHHAGSDDAVVGIHTQGPAESVRVEVAIAEAVAGGVGGLGYVLR